jgi:arylsulfatase A-like enzyme
VDFLKAPRTKPFLLVVSLLNPHDIVGYKMNPKPFQKMAQSVAPPPVPENFNATQQEPEVVEANRSRPGWTESDWRLFRSTYYRLMEICDGHIGQILEALRGEGLADNTIVIATSDHGECMGAHHLTSKEQLYEEAVAVPLIVTTPATSTAGGGRVDAKHLVSGLDLLPTMCDYAGIPMPPSFRGASLRPLVENRTVPWRDYLVSELADGHDSRMVRTARYKYIAFAAGKNREQLFDMDSDPGETKNLAGETKLQPVLDEHRQLLSQWLKETQDPFASSDKPLARRKGGAKKAKAGKAP